MAKNSEVYKTAQERAEAFAKTPDSCRGHGFVSPILVFEWLDLEADEEKPETIEEIVDEMRQHTKVSAADAFYGVVEWTKLCDRIIAAHNRVDKAVREIEGK